MRLFWAFETREAALDASHLGRKYPVPGTPYFYLQIQNIFFLTKKKSDFMEGLYKISRLIFVFPKPFLWLQLIFPPWGWSIQRHQVKKIRLSKLLKPLELTPCKGQNIYTWKMKTAIEWFPGPTNTVGVSGSEGAKDRVFGIICVHSAFVGLWLPVLRKIRNIER